jgi:hypothetical protein
MEIRKNKAKQSKAKKRKEKKSKRGQKKEKWKERTTLHLKAQYQKTNFHLRRGQRPTPSPPHHLEDFMSAR